MAERPTELNVHSCVNEGCNSIMFFDWGLELLDRSGYNTAIGPSQRKDVYNVHVKVCARCRTPQAVFDGELFDLSGMIAAEEVDTLIRVGRAVPPKIMDP